MWVLIREELHRVHLEEKLVDVEHVKAHRSMSVTPQTLSQGVTRRQMSLQRMEQ